MTTRFPPLAAVPRAPLARVDAAVAEELGLLIDGAINYAIYMLDPLGRVTIWNSGAERIMGWTEAEAIGADFALFYPPDDVIAKKPLADLTRTTAQGQLEKESWQLRKNGSEFLASVTMTALRDDAGALRGFGKVVRDITDQTAANNAIIRREQQLRLILDSVPDAMIVFNEAGIISSFSTAAERIFGYGKREVIGQHVGRLFPGNPEHLQTQRDLLRAIGEGVFDNAARKEGEVFPIELVIGETSIDGERSFIAFARDLTTRHQTERRMQELQSELVHVSRVSAMGTMASTLAHEINQPLTAIANYLEAARAMIGSVGASPLAEIGDALDFATAQSLRAGAIVQRLRSFVDGSDPGFQAERLDQLVEEAISLGVLGAHEAGVTVTTTITATRDRVRVDRIQIQQVLVNLIRNAIQSMAKSPCKELAIAIAPDREGWMRVTIADTGAGINPQVRERLFEAFATTKEDGMGLGLSICRTIIEAHGGRIWAEAGVAGGTVFSFCVPLAVNADE